MKKAAALFFAILGMSPAVSFAQGSAPELFGVNEVVIDYARFDDPGVADRCGLSRDDISNALSKAFAGTTVPAISVADAKPTATGTARIELIPEVSSHVDENLTCTSWVSLSAESHSKVVVFPVNTLRSEVVVYWRQHNVVSSGQSTHSQLVDELFKKMAGMFATQYKSDQPSFEPSK